MEEIALKIIAWLIAFTGALAIVSGCLWASLYLFGSIIKFLGYWKLTMKALAHVSKQERKRKS